MIKKMIDEVFFWLGYFPEKNYYQLMANYQAQKLNLQKLVKRYKGSENTSMSGILKPELKTCEAHYPKISGRQARP